MFKVIILVCAASMPPSQCQPNSAIEVVQGPDARNEIMCGMQSQAFLAGTAIGRDLRPNEYVKVQCRRTQIGKGNVG